MSETIATDNPLSPQSTASLAAIAGLMIPASAKYDVPAADDPEILAEIVRAAREHVELLEAGFAELNAATDSGDRPFADLSSEHQLDIVDRLRNELAPFINVVTAITVQCYYRDPRVMASLDMEARPPFPEGYEVPQGDWSMLDPVRDRGKVWRDA